MAFSSKKKLWMQIWLGRSTTLFVGCIKQIFLSFLLLSDFSSAMFTSPFSLKASLTWTGRPCVHYPNWIITFVEKNSRWPIDLSFSNGNILYILGTDYGGYMVYIFQLIRGRENTAVVKWISLHTHKHWLALPYPSAFSIPAPRGGKGIAH